MCSVSEELMSQLPPIFVHFALVSIVQHLCHLYTPFHQDTFTSFLRGSPVFNVTLLCIVLIYFFTVLLFLLGLLLLLLMLWLLSCIAFEQSASTLFFPIGPIILVHNFAQCMASQIIAKTLVYIFVFIGNILYTLSALRFLQLAIYLGELSKSVYRR